MYSTRHTYLVKSKTDTLLPTGDSSELPSGVKMRLPCPYTVPSRFENYHDASERVQKDLEARMYLEISLHPLTCSYGLCRTQQSRHIKLSANYEDAPIAGAKFLVRF